MNIFASYSIPHEANQPPRTKKMPAPVYVGKCIPMKGRGVLLGVNGVAATSAAPNPGDQGPATQGVLPPTPVFPTQQTNLPLPSPQGGALSKKIAAKLDGLKAQRQAGGYASKPRNIRFSL